MTPYLQTEAKLYLISGSQQKIGVDWVSWPFLISILHETGSFEDLLDAHHYVMNTGYNAFQ